MKICFSSLCVRRVRLASQTRPFQVDRNDEGIAITSSSLFVDAHPSGVVCVSRHGRICSRLLYHGRTHRANGRHASMASTVNHWFAPILLSRISIF